MTGLPEAKNAALRCAIYSNCESRLGEWVVEARFFTLTIME
jgi:hypothetical protein